MSSAPPSTIGWLATTPTGWPPRARQRDDDVLRPCGLDLEHPPVIDEGADHLADVVGTPWAVRHDRQQLLVAAVHWIVAGDHRGRLAVVGREVGQVLLDHAQAVLVVLHLEIGDPGDFRVDLRAAQVLRRDVLPHHRLHQRRATERHVAGALHHGDEVGQRRDVGGAGGARAHHGGHLGHHAGEDRLLAEELAGTGEPAGADRLLDARARRVDEPDHRDALGVGDLPGPVALVSAFRPIEPAMTVKS
jgi:hypothetical protein